jgi:hypothetical protein
MQFKGKEHAAVFQNSMFSQNGLQVVIKLSGPIIKGIAIIQNARNIGGAIFEEFYRHFTPLSVRPLGCETDGFHAIVCQFPNAGGWNASFCNPKIRKLISQIEPAQPMRPHKANQKPL